MVKTQNTSVIKGVIRIVRTYIIFISFIIYCDNFYYLFSFYFHWFELRIVHLYWVPTHIIDPTIQLNCSMYDSQILTYSKNYNILYVYLSTIISQYSKCNMTCSVKTKVVLTIIILSIFMCSLKIIKNSIHSVENLIFNNFVIGVITSFASIYSLNVEGDLLKYVIRFRYKWNFSTVIN